MAAKKPWYKGWRTSVGGALIGVGTFLGQLPGEFVLGTYHGTAITVSAVTTALGAALAVIGLGGKLEDIKGNAQSK
jgi:hypothetical protein